MNLYSTELECPEYSKKLKISALPSTKELAELTAAGFSKFVSVCGVQLSEIYAIEFPAQLIESGFAFQDVFSDGDPLGAKIPGGSADSGIYLGVTTDGDRQQFLQSVAAVTEGLRKAIPTCVFCHRGIGRSPVVAAGALMQFDAVSIEQAVRSIQQLHPRSRFTSISLAALKWLTEQARI
jgi:predicted protein tyrosine phosphatase